MKTTMTLLVILLSISTNALCGSLDEYPGYKKVSVACPQTYTNVALNKAYMQAVGKEFAAPYKNALEQKKQGLWMKHIFNPGPYGEAGPSEGEAKVTPWKDCIKVKGTTYAWAWAFQPHNAFNESIALVDLDGKFVALLTYGSFLSKKTKKHEEVNVISGDESRLMEVLRVVGYIQ